MFNPIILSCSGGRTDRLSVIIIVCTIYILFFRKNQNFLLTSKFESPWYTQNTIYYKVQGLSRGDEYDP